MVRIEKIKDIDMRDATMRLVEVGVTPMQIFDKESKGKLDEKKIFKNNIFSFAKGLFLDNIECKLNKFFITSANYKSIYNKSYENYRLTINRDYKEIIYPEIRNYFNNNPDIILFLLIPIEKEIYYLLSSNRILPSSSATNLNVCIYFL